MGRKTRQAKFIVYWTSSRHALVKIELGLLRWLLDAARRYAKWEKENQAELPRPLPFDLEMLPGIMTNPVLAKGARFYWNYRMARSMREPGLKPLQERHGGKGKLRGRMGARNALAPRFCPNTGILIP